MGKILLFHNNAVPAEPRTYDSLMNLPFEDVLQSTVLDSPYGKRNTGTYLMTDSLKKIVDADEFIPRFYDFNEHIDTVVTNILHRIGGNIKVDIPYWKKILTYADRVVPLSMGFAFDGGKIHKIDESLDWLIRTLAERCELGVRTEYDADFLNEMGVKNVRIIGCPSLFYHMDRNFKVNDSVKKVNSVNFNFTTDFANLGITQREAVEIHWNVLRYFIEANKKELFDIDFTMQKPPVAEISDIHAILLSYGEVHDFYKECGRYFYCVEDWIKGIKGRNDFSMGTRFHGNVAAILAGVPTLMVNVDKRMMGMNNFYKIPSIDVSEFDFDKPIEYYRDLADYSEFNKNYAKAYDNFVDYCEKNGVRLNYSDKER